MQLRLRIAQLIELLKEVRIHRGLKLVRVLEQFNEPVSVGAQILKCLQFLHGDAVGVLEHISNLVTVLDDLVTEARVVILQRMLLVKGRVRRVIASPILPMIGKHLDLLMLRLLLVNILIINF